jgi:hypothetical protein
MYCWSRDNFFLSAWFAVTSAEIRALPRRHLASCEVLCPGIVMWREEFEQLIRQITRKLLRSLFAALRSEFPLFLARNLPCSSHFDDPNDNHVLGKMEECAQCYKPESRGFEF